MMNPSTAELKPCPFCGGEAKLHTSTDNSIPRHATVFAYCKKCSVVTRTFTDYTSDASFITDAIEAWNRRADNEP
jgi:Lar family restriction alleviation protein